MVDKAPQMIIMSVDCRTGCILWARWLGVFGWCQGRENPLHGNNQISGQVHLVNENNCWRKNMKTKLTMIYWKGGKFWLGKLLEHPEIMTQGKSLKELEENIKDAYRLMVMEDVPKQYKVKAIAI
jgi:predicted RNase H-like HicB family nuclease